MRPGEETASEVLCAKDGGPLMANGPSASRVRLREDVGVSVAAGENPEPDVIHKQSGQTLTLRHCWNSINVKHLDTQGRAQCFKKEKLLSSGRVVLIQKSVFHDTIYRVMLSVITCGGRIAWGARLSPLGFD